ncbi:MAG TPA: DUF742 domain-containing protein [Pseudonocardiaceae bacterium]|nr:DUF742 domain-containing protein [Pseudonocardiaceae bacterium]
MSTPTGADGNDQSFANVLNNLSSGPWRLGGRGKALKRRPFPRQPVAEQLPSPETEGPDEWGEPAFAASVVRPYTWTGGRTSPVFDLAVETLVSTSEHGRDVAALTKEEHRAVAELCRDPRSVAEVAALLSLPLGVARVLLGDMANLSLIMVHRTANSSGDTPDVGLMERVLSGLRRL